MHPYILLRILINNTQTYSFQVMIVAILATRMHLYLWQMNRYPYRSGALVRIPISDASSAHFTM
jgi:hypothetical protein